MSRSRLVTLAGAACASGRRLAHTDGLGINWDDPEGRCWTKEFEELIAAYADATRSESPLEAIDEFVQSTLKKALRAQGEGEGEESQAQFNKAWAHLFGWTKRPAPHWLARRPFERQPFICYILCILWKAAMLRWNAFGRLFTANTTPPAEVDLQALAAKMNEGFGAPPSDVDLGFVFLGQFIDHDITFDGSSALSDDAFKIEEILNLRSPALDLDNVYGDGPEGSPYLYDQSRATSEGPGYLLLADGCADLPRNQQGRALIGDPRNDENLFVSQLQLQFLLFHNAILRLVRTGTVDSVFGRTPEETPQHPGPSVEDFEFARRLARWHYQWIAVHDFLPAIVDPIPLAAAHHIAGVPQAGVPVELPAGYETARSKLRSYDWTDHCGVHHKGPLMPVEFAGAAFRFAHSQVPSRLHINAAQQNVPLFTPRPPAPGAFRPAAGEVDWALFFALDDTTEPQKARPIDTFLASQLFALPFVDDVPSLPLRNLIRSTRTYRLATGETVTSELGLSAPSGMSPAAQAQIPAALNGRTPLWFYCLGEADKFGGKLGPVGGLLVAWTLLRLLKCDKRSYVNADTPWSPVLNGSTPGAFAVADLIRIAQGERLDACPPSPLAPAP
ncbi:MAG: hypothetical protein KC486_05000 [Myxococcales bacterium]|nr:hypothetical protein [Myxococcales bacterium]